MPRHPDSSSATIVLVGEKEAGLAAWAAQEQLGQGQGASGAPYQLSHVVCAAGAVAFLVGDTEHCHLP